MGLRDAFKNAVMGWRSGLGTPSMPFVSWGGFINGPESFSSIRVNAKVDPSQANGGRDNAVVGITINWIATSMEMAAIQVGTKDASGKFTPLATEHPFLRVMRRPNPFYSAADLNIALLWDWCTRGNAYEFLVRSRRGDVLERYWLPGRYVAPVPDAKGFVAGYQYQSTDGLQLLDRSVVIHHRFGVDPDNHLQGIAPLAYVYREIITDNAYSDWAAGFADSGGVPATIFSPRVVKTPEGEFRVTMTPLQADEITSRIQEKMSREPGKPRFVPGSIEMHTMGVKPDEMAVNEVRKEPEARIPAALGINPLVLCLPGVSDSATYSNLQTAVRQSWVQGILPILRRWGQTYDLVLQGVPGNESLYTHYDTSDVLELAADFSAKREDARKDLALGIISLEEARAEGGRSTDAATLAKLEQSRTSPTSLESQPPAEGMPPAKSAIKRASETGGDIYTAAKRYRAALLANEEATIRELETLWTRTYGDTKARLAEVLTALEQAAENGDNPSQVLATRLEELLPQMQAAMETLADKSAAITETGQRKMIATTTEGLPALAKGALGNAPASVAVVWNQLPAEAFEMLAGLSGDGSPLMTTFTTAFAEHAQDVRSALLTGMAQGVNPKQVAATISGLTGRAKSRLETIARTEMLRASREVTRQTYAKNADVVEGYIRLSAADARCCPACWALHGTRSALSEIMPTHPSCRCVMVPAVRSWAEITGDASLEDTRPEIATGEDAFKALSESEQREVLGAGMFDAWKSGRVSLSDMAQVTHSEQWGPGLRVRTLAEVNG